MEGSLFRLFGRRASSGHTPLPLGYALPERERGTRRCVRTRVEIPTDLLFSAFRQLFPAERMIVMGGRKVRGTVRVSSVMDVTELRPSVTHVRSDPLKLATALLDLSRSAAHFALWLHSHPGAGVLATHPSSVDLAQDADLRRHYSCNLVGLIATVDGTVRAWGRPVSEGAVAIRWIGSGISAVPGEEHVYRLQLC